MKIHVLVAILALGIARADLTLTQQMETTAGGKPALIHTKIKDGKIRTDVGQEMTAIIDSRTGDTTSLLHVQKAVVKLSGADIKAAAQASLGKEENGTPEPPKPTGRKETISGFECEEYVTTFNGQKIEVWLAKNVPDLEEIYSQLSALKASGGPESQWFSDPELKGIPVRTIAEVPGAGKATITLVSINRDPLPASDFEIPSGYQELKMPSIPGR
ncbi:MAG: DUF4412 domain-containing protein [Terrimicrobiaceae bacterium]